MQTATRWVVALVFLCSLVLLSPARVYATATVIAPPTVNEIYPNAPGSSESGFEFIELFNNSTTDLDVSGYQLQIKDKTKVMLLTGSIPAGGYKAFITSFSLLNSGEIVQLAQIQAGVPVVIEEVSYGSGALDTQSWSIFESGWELAPVTKDSINTKYTEESPATDACPATPEIDITVPDGYVINPDGSCTLVVIAPVCSNQIVVNEVFSDPIGLEADGGEFIELYNPSDQAASLGACQLRSSKSSQLIQVFTDADTVSAKGYYVVYSADKLTNASGSVTFMTDQREDVVSYSNMYEGDSMSLFSSGWEITNVATPQLENQHSLAAVEDPAVNATTTVAVLSPCPEGKYRSLETNRCRSIEAASAALTACDEGQYRSPETNRCRKVTNAVASLAPCGAGEERNLSTNRCRKIAAASTLKACEPGSERSPETNRCRKVSTLKNPAQLASQTESGGSIRIGPGIAGAVLVAALGYGIYEYRSDIKSGFTKLRTHFIKGRPPD